MNNPKSDPYHHHEGQITNFYKTSQSISSMFINTEGCVDRLKKSVAHFHTFQTYFSNQ